MMFRDVGKESYLTRLDGVAAGFGFDFILGCWACQLAVRAFLLPRQKVLL